MAAMDAQGSPELTIEPPTGIGIHDPSVSRREEVALLSVQPSRSALVSLVLVLVLVLILAIQSVQTEMNFQSRDSEQIYMDLCHRLARSKFELGLTLKQRDATIAARDYTLRFLRGQISLYEGLLHRAETQSTYLQQKVNQIHGETAQFERSSISYQRKMGENAQQTFSNFVQTRGSLENLEVAHDRLTAQFDQLSANYHTLQDAYSATSASLLQLQVQHQQLSSEYDDLQGQYNTLSTNNQALQARFNEVLDRYRQLAANYEQLRERYNALYYAYYNRR